MLLEDVTTSSIHDKGKAAPLRLLQRSKRAQQLCPSSPDKIGKAGIELFVLLYGGKTNDTLQRLRYITYMKMAAST